MQSVPSLSRPIADAPRTSAAAIAHGPRKRKAPVGEWLLFLLFIGPKMLLFGTFAYWPLVYSAYLGTVRWDMREGTAIRPSPSQWPVRRRSSSARPPTVLAALEGIPGPRDSARGLRPE